MHLNNPLVESIFNSTDASQLQDKLLHAKLTTLINNLIINDFDGLIFILYRLDVSEGKLKKLLSENKKEDAADIIATLIIERQLQKIKSRKEYKRDNDSIDEEEKW